MKTDIKFVLRVLSSILLAVLGSTQISHAQTKVNDEREIEVIEIDLTGNTIFSDEELISVLNLSKDKITLEELVEARKKIDLYYHQEGYVGSGSFIPPQEIVEGKLRLEIVEAVLSSISVKGTDGLSESYIKSQLPSEGKPVNINEIAVAISRLKNHPLIKTISSELEAESVGKNILLITVGEQSPFSASVGFNNSYSPSVGSFGGNTRLVHRNLLGIRDRLSLNLSKTDGLTRWGTSYFLPFNNSDGGVAISYASAKSEVVEEELQNLGIEADYESFVLNFSQPFRVGKQEQITLAFAVERIESETFVLSDSSFAFTEGLPDGKSKLTVLQLSQSYSKTGDSSLFLIQSQFDVGLDLFETTETEVGIDSRFWLWNGRVQYLKALNEENDSLFLALLNVQLTPDQLLPVKQITMGGTAGSVRGLRPNLVVADSGVIGTVEISVPLIRTDSWGTFSISPFIDGGTLWNNERETTGSSAFISTGLGLQYTIDNLLTARIDYAVPLVEADGYGETETEQNWSFYLLLDVIRF